MNSFINNNKQFFSLLLGLLLNSSLHAITVDNQPLNNFIQPGSDLCMPNLEKDDFIMLEMENDNINITCLGIGDLISTLKGALKKTSTKCLSPIRLTSDISSNVVSYKYSHLVGENIDFESKILLDLRNCLLEAPSVSITGDRMVFDECFLINSQDLYLCTNSLKSDYYFIKIKFHDQSEIPTSIDGSVDFLGSKIEKTLYLTNVKEIIIAFNPQVWNNSSSFENSKVSLELTSSNSSREPLNLLKNAFKRLFHSSDCFI